MQIKKPGTAVGECEVKEIDLVLKEWNSANLDSTDRTRTPFHVRHVQTN